MAADIMKEPAETCNDMIDVDILEIDGVRGMLAGSSLADYWDLYQG
jgi:hypothetical protein